MQRKDRYYGKAKYACRVFYCKQRRGSFCCRECPKEPYCGNPCRNDPAQCNSYRNAAEKGATE